jgi:hypothetical protein
MDNVFTMQNQSPSEFIEQINQLTQPIVHGTQSRFLTPILKHGLDCAKHTYQHYNKEHQCNHFVNIKKDEKGNLDNEQLIESLLLGMCYATHGNLADINFSKHIENLFIHYTKKSIHLQDKNSLMHLVISTLLGKIMHKHLDKKNMIKGQYLGCPLLLIYDAQDKTLISQPHHIEVDMKEVLTKEYLKIILAPEKYLPYIDYLTHDLYEDENKQNTIMTFPIEIIESLDSIIKEKVN